MPQRGPFPSRLRGVPGPVLRGPETVVPVSVTDQTERVTDPSKNRETLYPVSGPPGGVSSRRSADRGPEDPSEYDVVPVLSRV